LAANSDDAARRLFSALLCHTHEGEPLDAGFITAHRQWAFAAAAEAKATIEIHGAVLTRNVRLEPTGYLPNALLG
jgi:hypothetical protein